MNSSLRTLAVVLLAGALLWADEAAGPAEEHRAGQVPPPVELTPYQQLLLGREPLLLRFRLLKARRYAFDVASDPKKGEQLEADIRSAFQDVVALYDRYLKQNPRDARAHYDLGELFYSGVQDEKQARKLWLRAIELDPGFHQAYNSVAVHFADSGQHDKALRYVRKALELAPEEAVYHFNAATFYFNFRLTARQLFRWDLPRVWQEAMAEYRRAIELDPTNYEMARDYALSFYSASFFGVEPRYDLARSVWEQALSLAPDRGQRVMVLTHLARVSLLAGDREQARDYVEQALAMKPNDAPARILKRKLDEGGSIDLPAGGGGSHRRAGGRALPP